MYVCLSEGENISLDYKDAELDLCILLTNIETI